MELKNRHTLHRVGLFGIFAGLVVVAAATVRWGWVNDATFTIVISVVTALATLGATFAATSAAKSAVEVAKFQEEQRVLGQNRSATALAFAFHRELWDVLQIVQSIVKKDAGEEWTIAGPRGHRMIFRYRVAAPILVANSQVLGWFLPDVGASLGSSIASVQDLRKVFDHPVRASEGELPSWFRKRLLRSAVDAERVIANACCLLEENYHVPSKEAVIVEDPSPNGGGSRRFLEDRVMHRGQA